MQVFVFVNGDTQDATLISGNLINVFVVSCIWHMVSVKNVEVNEHGLLWWGRKL